ncbi:plastocyanin/azurin family copper-binding protein (plasmid) [Haladaptatus sp. SPP-AMP-3]|uniref:plastocyanin/azurin family copper-binding protein n=1 Tax=Haladaptatus sp. SPP-AMP-3 TaxID=3121295 RepID=UPI003C2EFEA2
MTDGEADESVTRRGFLLGSAGVVAAGAAGTAAAQEDGTTTSSGENNSSSGGGGGATKTVKVGPGGDLVFDPDKLTVTPGTTVEFVWESDGHNVVPESQPEGAGWEGSGSASELFDSGHTYSHTFSTAGEYAYVCAPHKSAGMTGSITVGSASGSSEPAIPGNAKTLGIATSGALAFTLSIGYFFMKFGGDYGEAVE